MSKNTTTNNMRQTDRMKTTVRLGPKATKVLDKLFVELGISKNAFFVMAILREALRFAQASNSKTALNTLEREFQKELQEARAALD